MGNSVPVVESKFNPTPGGTNPEIFVGLVAPVGTDLETVFEELKAQLREVNYSVHRIKLSALLHTLKPFAHLPASPEEKRIISHMRAGTALRGKTRSDILALLAVSAIRSIRENAAGDPKKPLHRCAYVFDSLKNPSEIETLRGIYGDSFFAVSIYSPREERVAALARRVAESHHRADATRYRRFAERLVAIDEDEGVAHGQAVSESFAMADLFVDCRSKKSVTESFSRFIEILFGYPFHTPTREEYGMFHARAAALRSADLSRQVGAAVLNSDGDLLAIGCNEVPRAGGGSYWPEDDKDHRDFQLGYESGARIKRAILAEVLGRLQNSGWLSNERSKRRVEDMVNEILLENRRELLRGAQILDLLEFGRTVHAEMAAICDAASRGLSVKNGTMYVTTFPCHMCARHIIASGISRVVYIEPYPKSRAADLHQDALVVDPRQAVGGYVNFKPFVGIAPRKYMSFFEKVERKDRYGQAISWNKRTAEPRATQNPLAYLSLEMLTTLYLGEELPRAGYPEMHA